MFNETCFLDDGLADDRSDRLMRICQLPNRASNPKCIAAGLVPPPFGFVPSGDPPIIDYGPVGTTITPIKPFLPGTPLPGTPLPTGTPTTAGGAVPSGGGGITDFLSSLPTWAWLGMAGLGAFMLLKRR